MKSDSLKQGLQHDEMTRVVANKYVTFICCRLCLFIYLNCQLGDWNEKGCGFKSWTSIYVTQVKATTLFINQRYVDILVLMFISFDICHCYSMVIPWLFHQLFHALTHATSVGYNASWYNHDNLNNMNIENQPITVDDLPHDFVPHDYHMTSSLSGCTLVCLMCVNPIYLHL